MVRYSRSNNGFTFIELVVVISLISLMLFIAVPRVQDTLFTDNTNKVSRWIMNMVQSLKASAVQHQECYVLHVSLDFNQMWVTHATMSDDEIQNASQNAYKLPVNVKLVDVEYPDNETVSGGQADINFYQKGYSDMAMIHIENSDDEKFSFAIEPFLTRVKLYQKYVGFED